MKRVFRIIPITAILICVCCCGSGCTAYNGIARYGSEMYLTGSTNFLIFTKNWIRRCSIPSSEVITCQDMEVETVSNLPLTIPGPQSLEQRQSMLEDAMPALRKKRVEAARNVTEKAKYIDSENLPDETKQSIAAKYQLLVGCRRTYSTDAVSITAQFIVSADGSVKKVNIEKIPNGSSFGSCVSRILSLVWFPEADQESRQYKVKISLKKEVK